MTELTLVGAYGSPYSRKMRSVLRYRRLPFRWVLRGSPADQDTPQVPVNLIPVLVFPAAAGTPASAMIDSTFQIRRLEERARERAVVPDDAGLALLDALLEDYADEWLTKAMFHYRWSFAPDIARASRVLPFDVQPQLPVAQHARFAEQFAQRQIGRLALVGSNPTTAPVIEASYRRLLQLLDAHLVAQPFVFGARPGCADFGLFGQLSQLALFDPTSAAIAAEVAPRIVAWSNHVDDLASLEPGDWLSRDALPATFGGLLAEIGRTYVPFLLANDAALAAGAERVTCTIDGALWTQPPFPYQRKCLAWLRAAYGALAARDRAWVDQMLRGTGCEALFAA